jgi:DNA-directed RNA polymerase specialized sigma24 family protein
MTRQEFDTWIEQHYGELYAVARRRTNSDETAAEALQSAVAGAYANETYLRLQHKPWTYFANAVRGYAAATRRGEARARAASRAVQAQARAGFSLGRKRPAPRAE